MSSGEERPVCSDCRRFRWMDLDRGTCLGYVVPAEMDVEECALFGFKPRYRLSGSGD